ncbi:ERMES complex subunit [Pichia californica]|nr:ERMES complex subunit [[Candida] californica]
MSFKLNWNAIEKDSFLSYARELLEEALNSGNRPSILSDDIKIVELNFGTVAPVFQILEIGDLGVDKFRGIFNFKYYGDASITVTTKISASLLKNYNNNIKDEFNFIKPNFIVSDCDFDIPLNLTLSNFKMSSIIIIVFSKTKGLTLVFKNDPLENIDVNSTFDRITPIANFLQKKIESQISDLFKEFLPSLLYKFSLKYTTQSFDQFHKDLLIEEQEEDDNRKKNRILLKDLDPENPFRISPGSLMRSTRLSSMRQTLSLGNGIDKLSCDRFNKDIITKAFMNIMLNSNSGYNSNRIELFEGDFEFGGIHDKLNFIKNFQNKAYNRNVNHKPKRRTVKMNVKSSIKNKEENINKVEESELESQIPPNSIKLDRNIDNSVFSDISSDLETNATSVMMSKMPSMSRNSVSMSRGVSTMSTNNNNTPIVTPNISPPSSSSSSSMTATGMSLGGSVTATLDNNGTPLLRADSNTTSTTNANILRKKSFNGSRRPSSNSRRMLLQNKDAIKIDKQEEMEIHRRMKKLDRLMNKKYEEANFIDSKGMVMNAPPPYSIK